MLSNRNLRLIAVVVFCFSMMGVAKAEPPARIPDLKLNQFEINDKAALLWNASRLDFARLDFDGMFSKYLTIIELTKNHHICEYFLHGIHSMLDSTWKDRRGELKKLLERFIEEKACLPSNKIVAVEILSSLYFRSGEIDKSEALFKKWGFIGDWALIGAFDNEGKTGLDTVYPPEKEWVKPDAAYKGKVRDVRWRNAGVPAKFGFVDLGAQVSPGNKACAYAAVMIKTDDAKSVPVAFRVGSSDAVAIWLNGREVLRRDVYRKANIDQDAVGVRLVPGWNTILVKVTTNAGSAENEAIRDADDEYIPLGAWGFYFRITGLDGSPLNGYKIAADVNAMAKLKPALPQAPAEEVPITKNLISYLEKFVEKNKLPMAYYLLGHMLDIVRPFDENDHPDREALQKAVDLEPGVASFLSRRALVEPVFNKKLELLRKALKVNRNYAPAHVVLGSLYSRIPGKAEKHFEAALKINPESPRIIMEMRNLYFAKNSNRESFARDEMRALCEKYPNIPSWKSYKESLFEGTVEERKKQVLLQLDNDYSDISLRRWLIGYYSDRRDYNLVDKQYEIIQRMNPYAISVLLKRSALARSQSDREKAIAFMKSALKIRPDSAQLHALLGEYYHEYGMKEDSSKEWDLAGELRKSFPKLTEYRNVISPPKEGDLFEEQYASDFEEIIENNAKNHVEYKDAGGVWLLNRTVTKVNEDGTSVALIEKVILILNEKGTQEYRWVDAGKAYHGDSNISKTQIKLAKVYKKGGREVEARFRRDSRYCAMPSLDVGDIVVVRSRVDTIGEPLYKKYFGDKFYLQERLEPVEKAEYVLLLPKNRKFNYHHVKFQGKPEVREDGDLVKVTWTASNLKKINPEPRMIPLTEVLPVIQISTFESWKSTAEWVRGIIVDAFESNDELDKKTDELINDKKTRHEKIRAIYEFVANEIRYNSFPLENHGYRPFKAFQTFTRKWGDCKDKAVLMMAMLKRIGIESNFVLVRALDSSTGLVDTTVPAMHLFNHAIVYVPDEKGKSGMFLDGTAARCPMGVIPGMDQGAIMFVVQKNTSFLTNGPIETADKNYIRWSTTVDLNEDGGAKVKIKASGGGQMDMIFRLMFQEGTARKDTLERLFNSFFSGVKVHEDALKFSELKKLDVPAEFELTLDVPQFAKGGGKSLRLPSVLMLSNLIQRYAPIEKRKFAMMMGLPDKNTRTVVYRAPKGYFFKTVPKDASIKGRGAKYSVKYNLEKDDVLSVEFSREMHKWRMAPEEYKAFRKFCQDVERIENREIVLEKK